MLSFVLGDLLNITQLTSYRKLKFLSFLSFLLMTALLLRPSVSLGIATGVVLGLTHYAKASVIPGFLIFAGVFF